MRGLSFKQHSEGKGRLNTDPKKSQVSSAPLFSSSVLFVSFVGVMNLSYCASLKSEVFFTRTSRLATLFDLLLQKSNPIIERTQTCTAVTHSCTDNTFSLRCLGMQGSCSLAESHNFQQAEDMHVPSVPLAQTLCSYQRSLTGTFTPSSTFLKIFL